MLKSMYNTKNSIKLILVLQKNLKLKFFFFSIAEDMMDDNFMIQPI